MPYRPAASAGPTTALPWRAIPIHEFADASIGVSTTSGTIPPNAGWKKPSAPPNSAASTRTDAEVEMAARVERAEDAAISAARATSEPIISSLRE